MKMTSNKPYLIRAIYEWIIDNKLTPHIVVDTEVDGVQVPEAYVKDDNNIVLDISAEACIGLHLGKDRIVFSASFSGVATQIYTPPDAVIAIYAKENGEGMVFTVDKADERDSGSENNIPVDVRSLEKSKKTLYSENTLKKVTKKNKGKTILKVIK